MEDLNDTLIILNEEINKKEQEISDANKELEELKHKHWNVLKDRNKHNALNEVKNFISIYGNMLDKTLHDKLRIKLIDIMYKDLYTPSSYDLVLRLMLNELGIQHQYLSKKKEPMQLQIDLKSKFDESCYREQHKE